MKTLKYILFLIPILMIGFLSSCEDEESKGDPIIKYIRVTNPDQADSLLVEATMGKLIVIIGENLDNVNEVFFNDQKAMLDPAYITSTSLMVVVPNLPPKEVTNKITMKTRDGRSISYDFGVTIPPPAISGVKCEYAEDGDTLVIYGNYFFDPEVYFPESETPAVIAEGNQTTLKVIVPQGAHKGQITIKTNFGKTNSKFKFRDNSGLFLDFDNLLGSGWHWHPEHTQSTNPKGASGKYYKFADPNLKPDDWHDALLECDLWAIGGGRPEGPLWEGGISGKALKFEVYVAKSWAGGFLQFIFMPFENATNGGLTSNDYVKGLWSPWLDKAKKTVVPYTTDGWITVSIPLSEFVYDHNMNNLGKTLEYPENCGSLSIFLRGPEKNDNFDANLKFYTGADPNPVLIYIDNIRVTDL